MVENLETFSFFDLDKNKNIKSKNGDIFSKFIPMKKDERVVAILLPRINPIL